MNFGSPEIFLYFGWLLFAVIVFYIISGRARMRALRTFASKEVLTRITLFYTGAIRFTSALMSIVALALIIIALARPQWSYYWKENKKKGVDIVIGVDVSKSMLATDVEPDRLSLAKDEIAGFVRALKGDRVALIAFSGSAFLQWPLTIDYKGFILALNSVGPGTISHGGTAISSAIKEAVRCYEGAESKYKIFILITDGEHLEGNIDKAIDIARQNGIVIHCIGVGSPEGVILYEKDGDGRDVPVKDKAGAPVITRLDETTLKKIAADTGGVYIRAQNLKFGLDEIYNEKIANLEKRAFEADKVKVYQEQYQYPAALALMILLMELLIRERGRDE